MSILDITIVVDPIAIIRDYPGSSNSTNISLTKRGYFFGLTNWNDVNCGTYYGGYADGQDNGEGGYVLDVKAEVNDIIRWRITSLTGGFEYQCFIQSFVFLCGASVMSPVGHKNELVSYPFRDAKGIVTAKQVNDYYWETTVAAPGTAGYHIIFFMFDSNGGRV